MKYKIYKIMNNKDWFFIEKIAKCWLNIFYTFRWVLSILIGFFFFNTLYIYRITYNIFEIRTTRKDSRNTFISLTSENCFSLPVIPHVHWFIMKRFSVRVNICMHTQIHNIFTHAKSSCRLLRLKKTLEAK